MDHSTFNGAKTIAMAARRANARNLEQAAVKVQAVANKAQKAGLTGRVVLEQAQHEADQLGVRRSHMGFAYTPHQGTRELARRKKRMSQGNGGVQ